MYFVPEACLVNESAAVPGAIRADEMCLLHGFYLHQPTVTEPLSHLRLKEDSRYGSYYNRIP